MGLKVKIQDFQVKGFGIVDFFDDELVVEQSEESGPNEKILKVDRIVNPSGGQKHRQPLPFYFAGITDGD